MLMWKTLPFVILVCSWKSVSIRWPAGTYGIPKPTAGCPLAVGFKWKEGWRSQDTNGKNSNNSRSQEFHLDGEVDNTKVRRSFCLKMGAANDYLRPNWPPGKYCIYKKRACPSGMAYRGFVYWDDEDNNNSNAYGGFLPGGVYDGDTEIRFCCRTGGNKSDPISLPTKTPFFLLAYESAKCQMVKWATASLEWIHYDTEHDDNADDRRWAFPYDAGEMHPTIYYCYYRGCNQTLTGVNGTFHSPNYPRSYPDGQYCSWRITVRPEQQVHLTFKNFSLQSENNTDSLYIYDGENNTREVIGVFYGGHPPPKEGVFSSSNHMFVIFKSDKNGSFTGFSAFYCEGTCPESRTSTPSPTVTPKTLHTVEKTTSNTEPTATTNGPSDESGGKGQRKQSKEKGLDIVAVVVPVVVLILLVALFIAGLFYYKRRRTKKEDQGIPNEVIYSRPYAETPMSLENMGYEQNPEEAPMSVTNPCYDRGLYSGLTIANRGSATEENELYTEVKEPENADKKEAFRQQSPVYATLEPNETMFNPIYAVGSM